MEASEISISQQTLEARKTPESPKSSETKPKVPESVVRQILADGNLLM